MDKKPIQLFLFFLATTLLFSFCTQSMPMARAQSTTIPGFYCYRSLSSVYQRVHQLESIYPQHVSVTDIGDSWEKENLAGTHGHDLLALNISNKTTIGPKPSLVLVSGLKANAFAPVETNLRFAEYLLSQFNTNDQIRFLLDHFSVHFIFVANPDGRTRAESQADGLGTPHVITWTKNTNPAGCSTESGGVSMERNFSFQWLNDESDPCRAEFAGSQAGSEPETQAIQNYLLSVSADNPHSILLINLESWHDAYITPYLYSKAERVGNYEAYQILANKLSYGTTAFPLAGDSIQFDEQHGSLLDYAHGELGMVALLYRMGIEQAGGDVSRCFYFEEALIDPALHSLLNALKSLSNPLAYSAGPEIVSVEVLSGPDDPIISISGQLDALSYYRIPNRSSEITSAHYSIGLPPWHPEAELIEITDFVLDPDFPSLARFSFSVDKNAFPPGELLIHIQGVSFDPQRSSLDAGFVHRLRFFNLDSRFNLYLPFVGNGID